MTDKMSANKRTDEDPPWANLLKNVLWTVATIYDIFSFVPYKILTVSTRPINSDIWNNDFSSSSQELIFDHACDWLVGPISNSLIFKTKVEILKDANPLLKETLKQRINKTGFS